MGIFSFFGLNGPSQNIDRCGQMLKDATDQKKAGNLDGAIKTLRRAFNEIGKTNLEYGIETFLRLPMYLQEAGRSDEAWAEFNKIITGGYLIPALASSDVGPMLFGQVHDKMRLFLQREEKHLEAVRKGILSESFFALGYARQKRGEEYAMHTSAEAVKKRLGPLLKKAKREDAINDAVSVLRKHYAARKALNPAAVLKEIDTVLLTS